MILGAGAAIDPAVSKNTSIPLPLGLSLIPVMFSGALSAWASSCLLLRRVTVVVRLGFEVRSQLQPIPAENSAIRSRCADESCVYAK